MRLCFLLLLAGLATDDNEGSDDDNDNDSEGSQAANDVGFAYGDVISYTLTAGDFTATRKMVVVR